LGRGTRITLYLKEDSHDFSEEYNIRKNIRKYSEFINFPIYLRINKTVSREEEYDEEEPIPESEMPKSNETSTEALEVKDESKTRIVKKKRTINEWQWDWELVNENKPIWLKQKNQITKEEYNKFYKSISHESEDALAWDHSNVEGEVNFKYLYYIPNKKPSDLLENYYSKSSSLKLYVRRVLVNEQFEEFLPRYLNFIKGIVDSDDLPLNVSREQLQQDKMIKVMSKKLVKNIITLLDKLSKDQVNEEYEEEEEEEEEEKKEGEEKEEEKKEDEKKDESKKSEKYLKFFDAFGKNIKLGVIEDSQNKSKLAKLLRFYSTYDEREMVSLDDYKGRKKEGQDSIYYIAGENREVLRNSPLLQKNKTKRIRSINIRRSN